MSAIADRAGDRPLVEDEQASFDLDQTASDRDQAASDRDQAASDHDLLSGGDAATHRISRDARERSTHQRQGATEQRVQDAARRDRVAHARDLAASRRDEAAAARDLQAAAEAPSGPAGRLALRGRARAAALRVEAAHSRGKAAADRAQAAQDREQAARDRAQADADRQALLAEIAADMVRERNLAIRVREQSALLELAPGPIFSRDARHRITFWNDAAVRTYGFERDEAIGRHPRDLLRRTLPIAAEEIDRHVREDGVWEGDIVQRTKDGRELTVHCRWGALYGRDGEISGLLEVNRDVTDRLLAQTEREDARTRAERERLSIRTVRAQRLEALGHLAGGIAHDFNNVLAVITGYASVLHHGIEELEDRVEAQHLQTLSDDVIQIEEASDRAAGLTRQLLSFARQETVKPDVIDVNATITEMLELLRRTLGEQVQLQLSLDQTVHRVRMDPGQLGQILVNLAVNSRNAMPTGGQLFIETTRTQLTDAQSALPVGAYVRLRVTDNGGGMSREVVEQAFDPFFTTHPVGEGTGLGLATVYGIAGQAGGQAELESEPGRGTTVTVLLPITDEPTAEARAPMAEVPARQTVTGTVLVVDDQPSLRDVTVRILTHAGYSVMSAAGGAEALALARSTKEPIDLLLTDVVMPEMLGSQLVKQLRLIRPSVKVLFTSGFTPASLDRDNRPLPGILLDKPVSTDRLLAEIDNLLRPGEEIARSPDRQSAEV